MMPLSLMGRYVELSLWSSATACSGDSAICQGKYPPGDLLPGQPSSSEPIEEDDLRCDADGGGGALCVPEVASILAHRGGFGAVPLILTVGIRHRFRKR